MMTLLVDQHAHTYIKQTVIMFSINKTLIKCKVVQMEIPKYYFLIFDHFVC